MIRHAVWAIVGLASIGSLSLAASGPSQRLGPWLIIEGDLPAPAGTSAIDVAGGDFEAVNPPAWPAGGEVVAEGAPQGKRYGRIPARKGGILMTPPLPIDPGRPHLLTFWLRSPAAAWSSVGFKADRRLIPFGELYPEVPDTGGRWRHVGLYALAPADARTLTFQIQPMKDRAEGGFVDVDDVRLRTATWDEMSAAYLDERATLPAYDLTPRPGDGRNLALSVAKWEGRGVPGRPFLIWAVGSSWTNFQGDGYPLIRAIRERFPHAPPILYRKHAGSGTPWDYARGWVEQFVAAESPDLVLTYTNGSPEGLDALLTAVRRRTTADVIVPSLHFFENSTLTEEDVERGVVDWDAVRAVCHKHDAEFVENRRELAAYLKRIGAGSKALLSDVVHQNQHGATRIWDNIVRHIARADGTPDRPESRERRLSIASPTVGGKDKVIASGGWAVAGGSLRSDKAGATLRVEFTGNRIDLLGRKVPGGGVVSVRIDGLPASQALAFAMNDIKPEPRPGPLVLQGPGPGDVAPHAVELGKGIIPQAWTITMTSDTGDYRLDGSLTGLDGEGNNTRPFRSRSGQLSIDPALWRHNKIERPGGTTLYANRAGDRFTFDIERTATARVSFKALKEEAFSVPLVRNLANGPHALELVADGDGEVVIDSLYVFEPPLK